MPTPNRRNVKNRLSYPDRASGGAGRRQPISHGAGRRLFPRRGMPRHPAAPAWESRLPSTAGRMPPPALTSNNAILAGSPLGRRPRWPKSRETPYYSTTTPWRATGKRSQFSATSRQVAALEGPGRPCGSLLTGPTCLLLGRIRATKGHGAPGNRQNPRAHRAPHEHQTPQRPGARCGWPVGCSSTGTCSSWPRPLRGAGCP